MIKETMDMMISLRMLKKSHIIFPRSPIRLMQIPKVMKNPITPGGETQETEHQNYLHLNYICHLNVNITVEVNLFLDNYEIQIFVYLHV